MGLVCGMKSAGFCVASYWDIIHANVCEATLAMQHAGIWWIVRDLLKIFRLPYGPWGGQKFWRDLNAAGASLQTIGFDAADPFLMWLRQHLEAERGVQEADYNVWQKKGVRCLGSKLKATRSVGPRSTENEM